ncbi:MAG: adenine phosphoribosyltransferase, partial [Bdellovibrionales bacterium]
MSYKDLIKDVPNFPQEGIMFKDITPVLENSEAFTELINEMAEKAKNFEFNRLALIESRGFIFGSALSLKLG